MRILLAILLTCFSALAAVPTIGTITVGDTHTGTGPYTLTTERTSVHFFVNVTSGSFPYLSIKWGTTSGVYPYETKSANCYTNTNICGQAGTDKGLTGINVTGLKPGGTYYFRPNLRPNLSDDTDLCNVDGCGATEIVVTMASGSFAAPTAATSWIPTEPDTSGYTIVSFERSGTGECWVKSPGVGSFTSHMTMTTALVTARTSGVGYVFEYDQGISCDVPIVNHTAYLLPDMPLDQTACGGVCTVGDSRHRWLVIRTKQNSASDFPLFMSLININFSAKLAKFVALAPCGGIAGAQLFDGGANNGYVHHIWFKNLQFKISDSYTIGTNYVDPEYFCAWVSSPSKYNTRNIDYLVFDRIYAASPGPPIRHYRAAIFSGMHVALVGSQFTGIQLWQMYRYPTTTGSLSAGNTVMTYAQTTYQLTKSGGSLGMSGGPATITLSGFTSTGQLQGALTTTGLKIYYDSASGTVTCNANCTAVPKATSGGGCWFTDTSLGGGYSGGSLWITNAELPVLCGTMSAAGAFTSTRYFDGVSDGNGYGDFTTRPPMSVGIELDDLKDANGGPYWIFNNWIDGIGEGVYTDPNFSIYSNNDVTYEKNLNVWPLWALDTDASNEYKFLNRQHFELKRGHRWLIKGGVVSQSKSQQNDGMGIFLSARPAYVPDVTIIDGISDITIQSNEIRKGTNGIECAGGNYIGNGGPLAEPYPTRRVEVSNNYLHNLGGLLYYDNFSSHPFITGLITLGPSCQDFNVHHNTASTVFSQTNADFYLGGGHEMGGEMKFQYNVSHDNYNASTGGGGAAFYYGELQLGTHPITPVPPTANSPTGASPDTNGLLGAYFHYIDGTGVHSNFTWSGNVKIPAYKSNSTIGGFAEMTNAEAVTYRANAPSGDTYATGANLVARQANVGYVEGTTMAGSVGVDFSTLRSDQGIVRNIVVTASGTSILFAYTAPDSRACQVQASSDSFTTISETDDGGGAVARTPSISGLSPLTTYAYRVNCYRRQVVDSIYFPTGDYSSDQITEGTILLGSNSTNSKKGATVRNGHLK